MSCVVGCPYDGYIKPIQVRDIAYRLLDIGCYEISLGDTIGVGTVNTTKRMLEAVLHDIPPEKLAVHYHDTHERALENILGALEMGITTIDSSVTSLGGCPYAKGATGNVSTEDVVYLLEQLNVRTGVDLDKLMEIADWISKEIKHENRV